jgi:hypothetical protein
VAIVLFTDTLRPGVLLQALAVVVNGAGEVVNEPVRWQSLTPSKLSVDAAGGLLALGPGVGVVRASVGRVVAERELQLVNPPAASIVPSAESLSMNLPGAAVQLSATPFDASGVEIVGAPVSWVSDAPRIASVNASGVVTPVAVGKTIVRAMVDGATREVPVRVAATPSATAPIIASIAPSVIGPGTPFTIRGSQLLPGGSGTSVYVDGFPAQLLTVSDSLITAVLSLTSLPCLPTADVAVQVSAGGGVSTMGTRLQLAPQRSPEVGEALLLTGAGDLRCLELPGEGEYLVSILNTGRALGAGALNLRFEARTGLAAPVSIRVQPATAALRADDAHLAVMEASRRAVPSGRVGRVMPEIQVAPLGELTPVRVPNLDASNICATFRPIQARTVYAGSRVYIVEDTATRLGSTPLLSGQMDAEIQRLGAEIDNVIWPIVTRFGDPLVMDGRLDANGRIVIALTPELNAMHGGSVFGAVVTCDFFSRSQFAASNFGEMLYLQVPTLAGDLDAALAIKRWRHTARGTVAHELKHVVSFAERIVRNLPLEELWLDEASAQHAEELFTRAVTAVSPTGDTEYASIRCEVLAARGDGGCADTPALMKPTLDPLWDFLSAPASRSPLGSVVEGDFSFYGSGWSLLRWAMDHSGTPEATFTQQLTVSAQSGVANLEARAGRSWEQMLGRWSLALATDGREESSIADPTLRFPSWNLSSVFAGLCADLGPCGTELATGSRYSRAHPLEAVAPSGNFVLSVSELAPAGFQLVRISSSAAGTRRFISLNAANGAATPSTARLAILRVN